MKFLRRLGKLREKIGKVNAIG